MQDRTFIIDSNYLDEVKEHLYGYMITNDGDIYIDEVPDKIYDSGLFCIVKREGNKIIIKQDFCTAFGLYLYQKDDYFVVSNSFFKMVEHINDKLSVNYEALDIIFYADDCPIIHKDTPIKEIVKLTSDEYIEINVEEKSISVLKEKYVYFDIKPDEKEYYQIIDKWFYKWVNVFRNLIKNGYPINMDLSGGLDTRIILAMMRVGNVDINSCVNILCHEKSNVYSDNEDLRISKEIASDLGFNLNSKDAFEVKNTGHFPVIESYNACKYTSFSRSNMNKYCRNLYDKPLISIKGTGSIIKGIDWKSIDEFVDMYVRSYDCYSSNKGIKNTIKKKINKYKQRKKYFNIVNSILDGYDGDTSHKATILFKKMMIENIDSVKALDWMNGNNIVISPFFDSLISKIDYNPNSNDKLFLSTLILDRFDSKLLNYDVENRSFNTDTITMVKELNKKYLLKKKSFTHLRKEKTMVTKKIIDSNELGDYLENIWSKKEFKMVIDKYFGNNVYESVINNTDKNKMNLKPQKVNILLMVYELHCILNQKNSGYEDVEEV